MKPQTSDEIRATFLNFFRERDHEVVASAGVAPRNDPTLLFTNAGMVQFKDVFLGDDKRAYRRATSSQKCIRMSGKHNDLENVGRTRRHHTFFEMLGNFSFGDYFKREAITFAWDLLTKVYGIPAERLVITVFGGEKGLAADDEARALWREVTGFGDERIIGMGAKDNFWSMGDTGPCGPCTEIHYFMGDAAPDLARFDQEPDANGTGWVEIWNLVFMQFNRAEKNGALAPLPAPCVDTGMGLERITAVLQGKTTNYDTDLLRPYVERAAELAGGDYKGTESEFDVACRVIADHARMAAFALAEGITPSNKDRGAALRSVMRRAIRHAYMQGVKEPSFHRVVERVIERMGVAYPELVQHREFIVEQARMEDARFRETIPTGLKLLEEFTGWSTDAGGQRTLPGDVAWDLNATYGFPHDLTEVIGQERGFALDARGYELAKVCHSAVSGSEEAVHELREMIAKGEYTVDELPERAQALVKHGAKGGDVGGDERVRREHREALTRLGGPVTFTGYDHEAGESELVAMLKGSPDDKSPWQFVDALGEGDEAQLVVRATPFYGESGGQVGDVGTITTAQGTFTVTDTQRPVTGLVVHLGKLTHGALRTGEAVTLTVDHGARSATRRNHSATHLLHWALRKVLGPHAQQKGSKVGPDALRFDYVASRALTDDEITRIEDLVNREVLDNGAVRTDITSQAEARRKGAMMIFEEKYGDSVRMLHIGSESVELCGGTHVARAGDIGLFKVVSDANVGAGVRRVEAVTGLGALSLVRATGATLRKVADALGSPVAEVSTRVEKAVEQQRALQKEIDDLKRKLLTGGGGPAVETHDLADGATLVVARSPVNEEKAMREYADHLRDKHGRAVVVIGAVSAEAKALLVCAVSKDLAAKYHAGKIVGALAPLVGGRGGGRPDMAGAGGPDAAKLDEALAQARTIVG
jgi:alanyl-tRNA synthetase